MFSILTSEIPDLQSIIEEPLAEIGVKVPSRPPTGVDRPGTSSSRRSQGSNASGRR